MPKRMRSAFALLRGQMTDWLFSPRTIIIGLVVLAMAYMNARGFGGTMATYSLSAHSAEAMFVYLSRAFGNVTSISAFFLIMVSEIPRRTPVQLSMLGTAFGRLLEAVLCVGIFYMNQSFGGGYHADTHMRCFVTMAAGLLIYILSLSLLLPPMVYWVCGFLALVLLYAVPLVLHKNKAYLARHKQQLIKRSRLVTLAQFSIFLLAGLLPGSGMAQVFGSALALCSVSRLAAKRVQHEKKGA